MSKQHIKKGDTVQVLAGEDRGKQGRVLQVLVKKDRVVVEGVNVVTKATKPSAQHPQGGLVKKEARTCGFPQKRCRQDSPLFKKIRRGD